MGTQTVVVVLITVPSGGGGGGRERGREVNGKYFHLYTTA